MEDLLPEQVRFFSENGYLRLASGFEAAAMEAVASEILAQLEEVERRRATDAAYQELTQFRRWTLGLHLRSTMIRDFVLSDIFKAIGRSLIGKEVDICCPTGLPRSIAATSRPPASMHRKRCRWT
jgi:hypothetical protein